MMISIIIVVQYISHYNNFQLVTFEKQVNGNK